MTKELRNRIESRCTEDGGCLLWGGAMASGNTPMIRIDRKTYNARRRYYELTVGPIPEGMVLAVTCECQRCMRHMEPQTVSQVIQRVVARGTFSAAVHGAKVAAARRKTSRYSDALISEIRASDEPSRVLAERLGMNESYLSRVRRGLQRRHASGNPFAGLGA